MQCGGGITGRVPRLPRRKVITKTGGAAGDAAAGVLDPAAPRRRRWTGRVKLPLVDTFTGPKSVADPWPTPAISDYQIGCARQLLDPK